MPIVYVGLDLGSSTFHQVAINLDGSVTVNRSFPTSELNLRKAFADLRGELHVHLEAGELAPWAAAVIASLVQRVVCSHPRDNAWIAKDGDKCDRVDAFKLAELLRLKRFKEVHYAPDQPRREPSGNNNTLSARSPFQWRGPRRRSAAGVLVVRPAPFFNAQSNHRPRLGT